jgi:DNA repair protein RecN (Recombination protein N)
MCLLTYNKIYSVYLNFQLQEIEKLNPSSQDEEDLLKKKNILVNYEKIQKLSFVIDEQFNGSENSIGLNAHLKSIHHILSKNIEIFGETLDVFSELDDKLMNLRLLVDSKLDIEIDATNLEDVLDRLDMYQRLKKKFGGSTDLIQECYVDFKVEKEQLESLDLNCDVLEKNISKIETELREKAEKIINFSEYAYQLNFNF